MKNLLFIFLLFGLKAASQTAFPLYVPGSSSTDSIKQVVNVNGSSRQVYNIDLVKYRAALTARDTAAALRLLIATNTSNISANTTAIGLKADKSATISINGTSQTLGSNPTFTISGGSGSTDTTSLSRRINRKPAVFNVLDYGAVADGITDNTTAFANCMTAVVNNNGGVFYMPHGVYVGKIVVPSLAPANWSSIEIQGESAPSFIFGTVGTYSLVNAGTILKSASTTGSVISVAGGLFSSVHLVIKNLEVRTYDNPNINGIDANSASQLRAENVFINSGGYGVQASFPANGKAGLITPALNNAALTILSNVAITGFYDGIIVNEHTDGSGINVAECVNAIKINTSYHASNFERLSAQRNRQNIYVMGTSRFNITQLNIEHADSATQTTTNTAWQVTQYDIVDSLNQGVADITFADLKGNVGLEHALTKNGGANIRAREIGSVSSNSTNSGDGITVTNPVATSFAFANTVNNTGAVGGISTYGNSYTLTDLRNNTALGATNGVVLMSDASVGSGGLHNITFRTGGYLSSQEKMKIASNGNVSIGTATGTDTTSGKVIITGTSNIGLNVKNTTASSFSGIAATNSTGAIGEFFKASTGYATYKNTAASDLGFYNPATGNISLLNDNATGNINFAAGGASAAQMTLLPSGNLKLSLGTAPTSATDTGTTGEVRITNGFLYICVATNTWLRSALTTW